MRLSREDEARGREERVAERIRSPSVRNEARDEEEATVVWSDGERSERIEITSATEKTGRRRRRRYAERGTWADRTRRAVARAHKLKPAPRRHCCLLRSTATIPPFPPVFPCSLIHPTALRYVTLCGVRLTNPTRSLSALPPAATTAAVAAAAAAAATTAPSTPPPVHPQARETARCRTTEPPHVLTPPLPGRLRSSPFARQPPARRPTPLRFARLRSRSLLSSNCRPRCGPRPFPFSLSCHYLATPGVTPFGQPAYPKAVRCGTRQAAPRLSFVRSYVARVCVRENAKGVRETGERMRERTAI